MKKQQQKSTSWLLQQDIRHPSECWASLDTFTARDASIGLVGETQLAPAGHQKNWPSRQRFGVKILADVLGFMALRSHMEVS